MPILDLRCPVCTSPCIFPHNSDQDDTIKFILGGISMHECLFNHIWFTDRGGNLVRGVDEKVEEQIISIKTALGIKPDKLGNTIRDIELE